MSWAGDFPRLTPRNHRVTSPATAEYNCIAWAAEDVEHWWQPGKYWLPADWPENDFGLAALEQAFRALGYESCGMDVSLEPGFPESRPLRPRPVLHARGAAAAERKMDEQAGEGRGHRTRRARRRGGPRVWGGGGRHEEARHLARRRLTAWRAAGESRLIRLPSSQFQLKKS